ncbi:MAG: hypothetical protein ACD_57C00059G0003, partial [uncultured bacterium]
MNILRSFLSGGREPGWVQDLQAGVARDNPNIGHVAT